MNSIKSRTYHWDFINRILIDKGFQEGDMSKIYKAELVVFKINKESRPERGPTFFLYW